MTISFGKARDSVPAMSRPFAAPSPQLAFTAAFGVLLLAASVRAQVDFEDVSEEAGLSGFTESWGASIGDLNRDNCLDIFHNGHRDFPRVYRNTCTGTFEDIAYEMDDGSWIELPTDDKHGATFGDFDNDGDDDLFIGVSVTGSGQMWVNQGDGTFLERASQLNLTQDFAARVAGFIDFNNDGKLDTFQMGLSPGTYFRYQNALGSFSTQLGTGHDCNDEDINFAHLMDIDNNGTLELLCVQRGQWPYLAYDITTIPFVNVTDQLPSLGNVNSTIVGDFDGNLRTDVLMIRGATRPTGAAMAGNNRVEGWIARDAGDPANYGFNFQTGGSITMTVWNRDLSRNESPFVVNLNQGQSGCNGSTTTVDYQVCATWNGSQGRWDVAMPDEGQAYIVIQSTQAITNLNQVALNSRDLPIAPRLYLNTAGGFNYSAAGLNVPVNCGGGTAADFDNDMDLDIYLTCGRGSENIPNRMLINQGSGTFVLDNTSGAQGPVGVGFDHGVAENAVFVDYDLNGSVDIFATNGLLFYPWGIGGPDTLLRNEGNSNHWLQFKLQGVASNRDGLGAKVYVTAGGKTQVRVQDGGYTRWAQNQPWQHFGLAGNGSANVQIVWPSGQVDNHNGVAADRLYIATEGASLTPINQGPPVFTTLKPGDECGEPPYNLDYGPVMFLWRDCGTDTWHFRAKGGRHDGAVLRAQGDVVADAPFSGVSGFGLAGGDSVGTAPATELNFNLGVRFTQDKGFNFSTSGQGNACFDFSDQDIRNLIVGAGGKRIQPPFDLVTLFNCNEPPPPELSISDRTANEGAGTFSFTVTLSAPASANVNFTVSTVEGTALVADGDFTPLVFSAGTIPMGNLSTTVVVNVGNDVVAEPDETFSVVLVDATNAFIQDDTGIGTIINDDGPIPTLSIADAAAFEDSGPLSFVVSLSHAAGADITFNASTQGQTATFADGDYAGFTGQPYSIPAGALSTTINVGTGVDAKVEADETLLLNLSNVSSKAIVVDGSAVGTIRNDDTGGVPNLTVADASIAEDSGLLSFTVSLTQVAAGDVTFTATTANGTATVGNSDYTALSAQAGVIPAGNLSTTVNVSIGIDSAVEPNESFSLTIGNVSGANLADGTAIGTIVNDDAALPVLSIADAAADEDAGTLSFTVSLNAPATGNVSFTASTANGTATAGSGDYSALVAVPGTITTGNLSTTVNVTIGADSDVEPDESLTVSLANLSGPAVFGDNSAAGTILNDDSPGGPVEVPVTMWIVQQGGVTTSGNRISFDGSMTTGWNSQAYSVPFADMGFTDAYEVRFEIVGNPAGTLWVVGLGVTESGTARTDVDYGFRISGGALEVRESGEWRTSSGTVVNGDVISIFVDSGTLEYRHNGAPVYTSTYAGSPPFYVDSAFKDGVIAIDVSVFGDAGPVDPPDANAIVDWVNAAGGVTANANDLSFSGTPNSWTNTINSVSLASLGAGDNYTVSWTIDSNPSGTVWELGLGFNETGPERTDIEHALRSTNGALEVRESGLWRASNGSLAIGDVLSIRVNGMVLDYQLNGVTFFSSPISGTENYYIDSAFKSGAINLGSFTLAQ